MNIRKNIILSILTLVCGLSFGQTATELRISELIEKLNWETIPIDCNYTLVLKEYDSIANELVEIGKQANEQLLNQLPNPEKSIGIHIILTRINDSSIYEKVGLGTKYIYQNCDELIGWHHVYNGIVWEWFEEKGQTISESELKKLTEYWKSKLTGNGELTLDDSEAIFSSLTESDNEKYPCIDNRNYENNSVNINIQELYSLLGKSNKSKEINNVMNRLGNDSIHSYYKDSYFINYDTDGLSFKFKKDSTLYCVFLEKEYKGTFWNGITLKDKKKKIRNKIKPAKSEKFGGGMENYWYTEPKFQIQFYSDDRIKYIMFNK
ncbi:hypothetical protein ACKGJY_15395 [Hyunsoonleella sp. 2307UL5-6]|uniref:hypothetical protein n=1 Tax=Hyunsoonleella sp. 2307UL5-6 TaxID=3384768 RepID=UPI0039BCA81C